MALLALLLGGAGGYAAARFLGEDLTGDAKARDEAVAALEKQVADLRSREAGRADQERLLRERVSDLAKANETLKALAEENGGSASKEAEAEIAALRKTLEEAGDLRAELNRSRRSLQVSELQIIELEGTIKEQRGEIEKLRASLTDAAARGDAGSKALSEQVKVLEAALADSRRQAAAAADLRSKAAALQEDIAEARRELTKAQEARRALERDLAGTRQALDKARAEVADLRKQIETARRDGRGESEALQNELAAAEEQLAARDGLVRTLEARIAAMKTDLDNATARAGRAEGERALTGMSLAAANAEKEKLEAEVAVLRQTVASLEAARRTTRTEDGTTEPSDGASARRGADAVRAALEGMPGYGNLTPDKQIELARRLEDGECAADALKASLGRVPAIALRNLIRDLGSKC